MLSTYHKDSGMPSRLETTRQVFCGGTVCLIAAEAPYASSLGAAPYASTLSLMCVLKNTWPGGHLPAQVGMLQPP